MLALAAFLASALCVSFTWPTTYKFTGEFQVMEANVTLPIIVNYNGNSKQENLMYFNSSMEYTIWDGTDAYYYVHVRKDHQECATLKTAALFPDMVEWLPDLTSFEDMGETTVRGVDVRKYQWKDVEGDVETNNHRTNIYTMYVDAKTNYPVRYDLDGYDTIIGSHYDQYRVEYLTFEEGVNDRAAYTKPSICSSRGLSAEEVKGNIAFVDRYGTLINSLMAPRKNFNEFSAKYGKTYATQEEAEYRYRVYQENLRTINAINADKTRTWRAGVNKFADMTMEEIKAILLSKRGERNAEPSFYLSSDREDALKSIPTSIDWRVHTGVTGRVKDQCACGSCWSFAATGALEGRYAVKNNLKDHVYFSEQFTIDCFWDINDHGCNGGNSENVFNWAAKEVNGYTTEADAQYIGINSYCSMDHVDSKYKVSDWAMVKSGDVQALKEALVDGPVAVAISVPESMIWYADGVYNDSTCASDMASLGHAVTAEGYSVDGDNEYWIIKNSWSTWWGKDGYIFISTKDNLCGVATDASYPIF